MSAGSSSSTNGITTTKPATVRNCRRRYAAAPSWTARPTSIIRGLPWLAASTSRTRYPATSNAIAAMAATLATSPSWPPLSSMATPPGFVPASAWIGTMGPPGQVGAPSESARRQLWRGDGRARPDVAPDDVLEVAVRARRDAGPAYASTYAVRSPT